MYRIGGWHYYSFIDSFNSLISFVTLRYYRYSYWQNNK